jgi:hypothetical protein
MVELEVGALKTMQKDTSIKPIKEEVQDIFGKNAPKVQY